MISWWPNSSHSAEHKREKVRGITDTSVFSCMWQIKVHPGIWRTSASSHLNMLLEHRTLRSVCLQISQQILISQQNLIQLYCSAGSGLVCWFCSSPVHMSSVQNQSRTPDPTLSWWWWMIWALETSVAMETAPSGSSLIDSERIIDLKTVWCYFVFGTRKWKYFWVFLSV